MQIADAWPFQARNQFRCFDSQPLLLTHFEIMLRTSVALTVFGGTILFGGIYELDKTGNVNVSRSASGSPGQFHIFDVQHEVCRNFAGG